MTPANAIRVLRIWRQALAEHHMNRVEIAALEAALAALEEKAESL
ncbi:hypothetical protein KABACHOK_00080 [Brevundimonas phage vB_BpoS-Kabachok]|uniref:Uncharacterized protein n=1 Tax=Brevundimonas phage vB_BpoS-Kabachok TaxID=2948600 RepID=A0A9E7MNV6_9CAUD|nr:hypothetical protein KABACHOK_00080 [Brevundimonas phage vB_BpoS-Kabachok]